MIMIMTLFHLKKIQHILIGCVVLIFTISFCNFLIPDGLSVDTWLSCLSGCCVCKCLMVLCLCVCEVHCLVYGMCFIKS